MAWYQLTFSPTGGTQKVANLLTQGLGEEFVSLDLMDRFVNLSSIPFAPDDCCLVAVPSFGGRVPAPAVQRLRDIAGNGARAVLVVVYGNRAYDDTLLELRDVMVQAGFRPVAGVAAVAEHSLMRQFGTGRPDEADRAELKSFAQTIRQRLDQAPPEDLALPGNYPYQAYGGVPLKPAGKSSCTACGLCAETCPTGAISKETPRKTDAAKCISCMACVARCPTGARQVSRLVLFAAGQKMKAVCGGRKPNELF